MTASSALSFVLRLSIARLALRRADAAAHHRPAGPPVQGQEADLTGEAQHQAVRVRAVRRSIPEAGRSAA